MTKLEQFKRTYYFSLALADYLVYSKDMTQLRQTNYYENRPVLGISSLSVLVVSAEAGFFVR